MTMQRDSRKKILFMVQFSILLAIEAVFCFVPWLGSIPIPPLVATLSHLPVIITAILLGTRAGAAMGFCFGLFSFLVWTFAPPSPVAAFVFTPLYSFGAVSGNFWSLVICFVPRILIGVVAGLCFRGFKRAFARFGKSQVLTYALAGFLASLTNTVLVLGGIYVFFGQPYAEANGVAFQALLGILGSIILTNGLLEAGIGAVVAYGVCRPLKRFVNAK